MSDAIWYGRLLVWIGALVLLIEAFAERSNGLTTAIAVIMLIAGLASLVYGLAFERRGEPAARPARAESQPNPED